MNVTPVFDHYTRNMTFNYNRKFSIEKVHIKSVREKNEESLLVISYFPHFG